MRPTTRGGKSMSTRLAKVDTSVFGVWRSGLAFRALTEICETSEKLPKHGEVERVKMAKVRCFWWFDEFDAFDVRFVPMATLVR